MNRTTIILVVITMTLLSTTLVFAQSGMGNVKGQVSEINPHEGTYGTITIYTQHGDDILVYIPPDFDLSSVKLEDYLHIKGQVQEDGSIVADWMKDWDQDDEAMDGEGEGSKANSAFCSSRKDKPHPLAVGIAATYGFSEADVMTYFCDGYGFGQIMLALQTEELGGDDVSVTLSERRMGKGWGQIWKESDLIGKPEEASSPPGHLKRPAHAGPPES